MNISLKITNVCKLTNTKGDPGSVPLQVLHPDEHQRVPLQVDGQTDHDEDSIMLQIILTMWPRGNNDDNLKDTKL